MATADRLVNEVRPAAGCLCSSHVRGSTAEQSDILDLWCFSWRLWSDSHSAAQTSI
jgi:hypothetical protein